MAEEVNLSVFFVYIHNFFALFSSFHLASFFYACFVSRYILVLEWLSARISYFWNITYFTVLSLSVWMKLRLNSWKTKRQLHNQTRTDALSTPCPANSNVSVVIWSESVLYVNTSSLNNFAFMSFSNRVFPLPLTTKRSRSTKRFFATFNIVCFTGWVKIMGEWLIFFADLTRTTADNYRTKSLPMAWGN